MLVEDLFFGSLQLSACDEKNVLPHFIAVSKEQMVVCIAHVCVKYQQGLLGGQLLNVLFVHECFLPMALVM